MSEPLLLLYGSLRAGQPKFSELGLHRALEFLGPTQFDGDLYDLGDYPGAVPGTGIVRAEAYKVRDPDIFGVLDEYEEFDVSRPDESLFVRRCVHVKGLGDAWVYFYNGPHEGRRIASGDWIGWQSAA